MGAHMTGGADGYNPAVMARAKTGASAEAGRSKSAPTGGVDGGKAGSQPVRPGRRDRVLQGRRKTHPAKRRPSSLSPSAARGSAGPFKRQAVRLPADDTVCAEASRARTGGLCVRRWLPPHDNGRGVRMGRRVRRMNDWVRRRAEAPLRLHAGRRLRGPGGCFVRQMRATPLLRAASATAAATVLPTRGSNALGMMYSAHSSSSETREAMA